jgi:hypothetical protein
LTAADSESGKPARSSTIVCSGLTKCSFRQACSTTKETYDGIRSDTLLKRSCFPLFASRLSMLLPLRVSVLKAAQFLCGFNRSQACRLLKRSHRDCAWRASSLPPILKVNASFDRSTRSNLKPCIKNQSKTPIVVCLESRYPDTGRDWRASYVSTYVNCVSFIG